jgi:methionyl-tRNA synthetase
MVRFSSPSAVSHNIINRKNWGKQVLFIANLAPRQFKNGLVSEGMILSAENFDGTLAVTSLLREVKPGSEVK